MKKNTLNLLLAAAALVLVQTMTVFAQYQPIWDDTSFAYIGVRADRGTAGMNADLSTVNVPISGKYVVWANMVHDSGDEQLNESYYITVVHEDGTESTPLDPNAGPYKVIADYPGMTSDPIFENTGRFLLKAGLNTVKLHHYALIADQYPQFLNGKMGGEHGEAESLYIQDSLMVLADPDVDGLIEVDAWTQHTELVNNHLEKTAYAGEKVDIRFKAVNYYINDIRFAKMYGTIPDSLHDLVFSVQPNDTLDNQYVWNVPQLAADDSFSVWVSGKVANTMPEGLLFQNVPGRLHVNSDIDTTNNLDGDHYWARPAPLITADMSIRIDAATDSVLISGQDTLKYAQRNEQVPFTLRVANLLPDTARNVRVVTVLPEDLTYISSNFAPTLVQGNQLEWDFTHFAPNSQQSWVIQTRVNADTPGSVTSIETPANVYASNDTLTGNNSDSDVIWVYTHEILSDVSVTINAVTDTSILINNQSAKAVVAGDSYALQILAKNAGPDTAQAPVLRALLPDSITITQFSTAPSRTSGDTLIWDLAPMIKGAQFSVDMTAQSAAAFPQDPYALQHVAMISAVTDHNLANNQDTERVYAIKRETRVDLAVTVNAITDTSIVFNNQTEKAVLAGDSYKVDLVVRNEGPAAAVDYRLWTLLPDSVTVTSFSVSPTSTVEDTLIWDLKNLSTGTSRTISMNLQTVEKFPAELFRLDHTATISTDQPDVNPANNTDNDHLYAIKALTPIVVDMGISVRTQTDTSVTLESVSYPAVVGGDSYRFYMDITNTGTSIANSSTVETVIPDSVTVVGYNIQPTGSNGATRRWQLGAFAPDSLLTLELQLVSKRDLPSWPYKVTHTAQVTNTLDVNPANNSDVADVYILEPSDTTQVDVWTDLMSITERTSTVNDGVYNTVYPGDTLDYIIRYGNLGPDDAMSVNLVLTVPDYINLFDFSVTPLSKNGSTVNWRFDRIATGAQTQVHFRAVLATGTESKQWIPTAVTAWLAQRDVNPNNNSDTDSVRIVPIPRNFDARIAFVAEADSDYTVDSQTWPAVLAGNQYSYRLTVTNDGPRPGLDITVTATVPETVSLENFSTPSESNESYKWNLDTLQVGESWTVTFDALTPAELASYPYPVPATAAISAASDTVAANNTAGNTVYILEPPEEEIIDVTPVLSAETDSSGQVNGVTYPFAREDETYNYALVVKNLGNRDAVNVRIVARYPDQVTLDQVFTSAYTYTTAGDSITWTVDLMTAGTQVDLGFAVNVPQYMPVGINDLECLATVSAANETPGKTGNNSDELIVKNYVKQPAPFIPEITVAPALIDITDSAKVSVRVPVEIESWDLRIISPTGEIITDFADSYIETHLLQPGMWYDVDDWYNQPYLYSGKDQDQLIIEIHAWDHRGTEGVGQAPLVIRSGNHMVLDRNVFKPGIDDYVDIRFKLSYERLARLDVYDVSGRLITTLAEDIYNGGWNSYLWNGQIQSTGMKAGSGVYLITLDAGDFKDWKKLIIVR